MNAEGYPEEKELQQIREWSHRDMVGLMDFIRSIWWMPEWGFQHTEGKYELHTGGWSGNEDIIVALQENKMCWILCWQESRRGGHYKFTLPPVGMP